MNCSESAALLDEDALLLHARLKNACALPVARLAVKRFTRFESSDWTSEERRDEVLSTAFDWCVSPEGSRILRVADQLYAGIENHKLFSVAKAICVAVGDAQLPAEVLERVKACCALLILDVDAEFHTILTEGEGDAASVVREVLQELEAQNRSSVADVESLSSPMHGMVPRATAIGELLAAGEDEDDHNDGESTAAKTSSTTASIPSISAEHILCNCVRYRLTAAGVTLDDRTLSDFVWRAVNDPAVLGSDPSDPASSLYAFLGSAHSVEAMVNQVIAEASLGNLLKRVPTAESSAPESEGKPPAKPENKGEAKQPAEVKAVMAEPVGDEEFVLPRVHFGSEEGAGDNLVEIVMERTKASRQECAHVLEAVDFDVDAAVAILCSSDVPVPAATPIAPGGAHDDESGWILTEAQAEALQYFRSTAMQESDNAMLRLAKRFRDCGFTKEHMRQTLRFMCTEAPITIQCNIDCLRVFLRTGVLPRGASVISPMGPVCYPARVHSLLHDSSHYGGDQDDLPTRATSVPARRSSANDVIIPAHQVVITLRGVHSRSTIVHKLSWPAMGPEAVRLGMMEHCAHVLDGYTDPQLRMLVSTAANAPFRGGQSGFVVPPAHDVFIHGRLTIENIQRVRFRHYADIDVEMAGALQRHLIPTENGPSSGTDMPKNGRGKGKKAKQANNQPQQHVSFAAPAHSLVDGEDEMLRRAIQDSLDMLPGTLP